MIKKLKEKKQEAENGDVDHPYPKCEDLPRVFQGSRKGVDSYAVISFV